MKTKKIKTHVLTVAKHFPSGHYRAGQQTFFPGQILSGIKIHTIRGNYERWVKAADEINAGKGVLSVRVWSGRPYHSKQVEIAVYKSIGLQRFEIDINGVHSIDGFYTEADLNTIANNDGLSDADFIAWFPTEFKGCIIHFTDYMYID